MTDSQETTNNPPLEVVSEGAETGGIDASSGRGGGLRKVFWIAAFALVLLAVAALGTTGYLGQREMRERITTLETELGSTREALALERAALGAERARADGLQTTMGRVNELANLLAASLQELQALTGSAPVGLEPSEAAPGPKDAAALEDSTLEVRVDDPAVEASERRADTIPNGASATAEANGASEAEAPGPGATAPAKEADAIAEDEIATPGSTSPSILEDLGTTAGVFLEREPDPDEVSAALSEISEASELDKAAAEAVEELPAVSTRDSASAGDPTEAATPREPSSPSPPPTPSLWERTVEQLRSLAPEE